MGLTKTKLTASYEQRQAYIDYLVDERIASKDEATSTFLEWEIGREVEHRGPEQFPPAPAQAPPTAKLLAELKLNKFGQPEGQAPSDGDDAESVEEVDLLTQEEPPVPDPWPEEAEEDPGGYGFPL